jgi:hypothetical protein
MICKNYCYEKIKNDKNTIIELLDKIGETVYVISPCQCRCSYFGESDYDKHVVAPCDIRPRSKNAIYIERVRINFTRRTRFKVHCLKLYEKPFDISMIDKLGKTVFFKKEKALNYMYNQEFKKII